MAELDHPDPISPPKNREQMRLVALSRLTGHISAGAMIIIPIAYLLVWFGVFASRDVMGVGGAGAFIASPDTANLMRLGGFAMSMVPQVALLYGLMRLRKLFAGFAGGNAFGAEAAGHMKGFARALLIYAILDFAMEAPLSALVTSANPPGERMVTLSFGGDDVQTYFLILLFFALSYVMAEGIRLARENAEFV